MTMTASAPQSQQEPHERHPHGAGGHHRALHEGSPLVGGRAEVDTASETDESGASHGHGHPPPPPPPSSPSKFKSLMRHFSMDDWTESPAQRRTPDAGGRWSKAAAVVPQALRPSAWSPTARKYGLPFAVTVLAILIWSSGQRWASQRQPQEVPSSPPPLEVIVPIEHAHEAMLDLGPATVTSDGNNDNDDGTRLQMWYRTWGNRRNGVPVLFVHGGPGNCIADYGNVNARFFAADSYFVVESDQRGTGKSQPSVRESCSSMKYYRDISIDKMAADYELLREALGIDRWLVFGGSWGSTLSLDYAERYPDRCLGLILRGVYLNTRSEFDDVFSRRPYLHNPKRLAEFDLWFRHAAEDAEEHGEEELDPNDSRRFFRIYERLIERCDREAIWGWHVFENNLIEEDPHNLLDPKDIQEDKYPEARSVAFFESRLFLHGTFEDPVDLLGRVPNLKRSANNDLEKKKSNRNGGTSASDPAALEEEEEEGPVHTWICQGHRDEVCPERYARKLADALDEAEVPTMARFIDAGHECTDPVMAECLKLSLKEFLEREHDKQRRHQMHNRRLDR